MARLAELVRGSAPPGLTATRAEAPAAAIGVIALAVAGLFAYTFLALQTTLGPAALAPAATLSAVALAVAWRSSRPVGLAGALAPASPGEVALPFTALLPLAALLPEFALGQPGVPRVTLALGTSLGLFALLRLEWTRRALARLALGVDRRATLIVVLIVVGHALATTALLILRHQLFNPVAGEDTAYYNQTFWNTLHGHFFAGTLTQGRYSPPIQSEFAAHNSPILFLLVPAYWARPSVYTLLGLRNIALSASAIPLFLLGRPALGAAGSLTVTVAYLLSPSLVSQALNAFYPLQFVALFLAFAALAFQRARFALFVVAMVLSLSVREEVALTVCLFSVYAAVVGRSWRWVVTPALLSMLWWYVSTELVMARSQIAMEQLEGFFQTFPKGYNSVVGGVLTDPAGFLRAIATPRTLAYVYELVRPTALLSLVSPAALLALPTMVTNLVVGLFWETTLSIPMHYSIVATVCLFIALVDTLSRFAASRLAVGRDRSWVPLALAAVFFPLVLLGVKDTVAYGAAHRQGKTLLAEFARRPDHAAIHRVLQMLETAPDAAVAAPNAFLPHLSHRMRLYNTNRLWWYHRLELDYIVLDADLQRAGIGQLYRKKYASLVTALRRSPDHELVMEDDGYEVYRVRPGRPPLPAPGGGEGAMTPAPASPRAAAASREADQSVPMP